MTTTNITLPFHYEPRKYQLPLLSAFDSQKYSRFVEVAHRRWGKEKTSFNIMIREMMKRVGIYYYFFPTYSQGRKILWEGIDKDGFKFLNHFPPQLLDGKPNDTEMKIKMRNGSLFRIIGTDNYNDIMGTNPVGCVFTEYALQNPSAWDYIRPILMENKGWAIFCYTPRGFNHGKTLYDMASHNPLWYCEMSTVTDTGVISEADIEAERQAGMDEDLIQQEFFCNFGGSMQGSYYSKQIKQARDENRICNVPYVQDLRVNTAWDLGVGDAMAIWFYQNVNKEIRFIDYLEVQGEGLDYCVKELQNKKYIYDTHLAPHDIKVRELSSGKSRLEIAEGLGIKFEVCPNLKIDDGIDAVRRIFNRCWFDEKKCERGLNALISYRKEYDDERKIFKDKPLHDFASHSSDAFRMFAIGFRESEIQRECQSPDWITKRRAY